MLVTAANEKLYEYVEQGFVRFNDVVVGPVRITFNQHTHRGA